jgi:hypothetical protein
MCTHLAYFHASTGSSLSGSPLPQPGEIWEVSRQLQCPIDCSNERFQSLYSQQAQQFIQGNSSPRYVMIVNEPEPPIAPEEPWQLVSVMVLSDETSAVSDVDVLLPGSLLDLKQDLLAETWNVQPMLVCNLTQASGKRLSREVYDLLMSIGDIYHGLAHAFPSKEEMSTVGLTLANRSFHQPEVQAFHQQETAWSDVLSVPVAAYYTYSKAIGLAEKIAFEAGELEQEFASGLTFEETSAEEGNIEGDQFCADPTDRTFKAKT